MKEQATDQATGKAVTSTSQPQQGFTLSRAYLWYAVTLLWLVALFRFVDLQIIAILLESIKADLQFSDTQLGLLTGVSFAIFYATLGLPIAWLADRYSRNVIISVAVGLWSMMTALCGMTTGFASLFLARMGVGVGEAGGYPPTTSILADYVEPRRRGLVFSLLGTAIPMGVFAGFLIGGILNAQYGWRVTFMAVGLPGLLLAALVKLTLREPPRGYSEGGTVKYQAPPFKDAIRHLWQRKSYRFVVLAACIFTLGAYGSGVWIPSFFMRVHGMSSAEVGIWMALLYGGGGLIGAMLGGSLGDYMANRTGDPGWYMRVCGIAVIAIVPFACFVYLWPEPRQALMVHFCVTVLMHMNLGPVLAHVQAVSGVTRRSMGQAVNVMVTNLIALSLGPLIVGAVSDSLTPAIGPQALGYGILGLVVASYSLAGLSFLRSTRYVAEDLAVSRRESELLEGMLAAEGRDTANAAGNDAKEYKQAA